MNNDLEIKNDGILNFETILKYEFIHDNELKEIENNKFFDLINDKEIDIGNYNINMPIETYLKYTIFNCEIEYNKIKYINKKDLEYNFNSTENIVIFDNRRCTQNNIYILKNYFNCKYCFITFISWCESLINNDSIKKELIWDKFYNFISRFNDFETLGEKYVDISGNFNNKYLDEAIKIGLLFGDEYRLINFNNIIFFDDNIKKEDVDKEIIRKLINELKYFKKYIDNIKHYKYDFYTKYLKLIDTNMDNILKDNIENNFNFDNYKKYYDNIKQFIFSCKEARDTYYFIESNKLKTSQYSDKNLIYVSVDEIACIRSIFYNIHSICILNDTLKYICISQNNNYCIKMFNSTQRFMLLNENQYNNIVKNIDLINRNNIKFINKMQDIKRQEDGFIFESLLDGQNFNELCKNYLNARYKIGSNNYNYAKDKEQYKIVKNFYELIKKIWNYYGSYDNLYEYFRKYNVNTEENYGYFLIYRHLCFIKKSISMYNDFTYLQDTLKVSDKTIKGCFYLLGDMQVYKTGIFYEFIDNIASDLFDDFTNEEKHTIKFYFDTFSYMQLLSIKYQYQFEDTTFEEIYGYEGKDTDMYKTFIYNIE